MEMNNLNQLIRKNYAVKFMKDGSDTRIVVTRHNPESLMSTWVGDDGDVEKALGAVVKQIENREKLQKSMARHVEASR